MINTSIYKDIATRTDGDIYIGVVGPVRTGKSTFIKRFMETLVIPNIENAFVRERAKDELPQSGSGKTIMTAEPKFVPEEAVSISVDNGPEVSVRLVDCVGYIIDGALGSTEDGAERMVTTTRFDTEVTMRQAAEEGTHRVITDHSTIGIVITTDGTVTDFARSSYEPAEERVISEMQSLGKPFVIILNTANPESDNTRVLCDDIEKKYGVRCVAVNCAAATEKEITKILCSVLYEFPINCFGIFLPSWVDALPADNKIKSGLFGLIAENAKGVNKLKDIYGFIKALSESDIVSDAAISEMNLGTGKTAINVTVPRNLFYETVSEQSSFDISDDGDLIELLARLSQVKTEYDKIAPALAEVREKGYGIVLPSADELVLQEPEIVKRGGKYGVKLKASAPSIHMIMTDVETEVSPAVGGEKASSDIINFLLQEFEGDTGKIWESNLFGKSMHDIANESLHAKAMKMPDEAQNKLRNMVRKIVNDGSGGVICIIL